MLANDRTLVGTVETVFATVANQAGIDTTARFATVFLEAGKLLFKTPLRHKLRLCVHLLATVHRFSAITLVRTVCAVGNLIANEVTWNTGAVVTLEFVQRASERIANSLPIPEF
jgi:hypothetical protein